jgi:hypothetical protein
MKGGGGGVGWSHFENVKFFAALVCNMLRGCVINMILVYIAKGDE